MFIKFTETFPRSIFFQRQIRRHRLERNSAHSPLAESICREAREKRDIHLGVALHFLPAPWVTADARADSMVHMVHGPHFAFTPGAGNWTLEIINAVIYEALRLSIIIMHFRARKWNPNMCNRSLSARIRARRFWAIIFPLFVVNKS